MVASSSLGAGLLAVWAASDFRASGRSPQQVSQLRYDDARTLVANGILPRHRHPAPYSGPRAFPGEFVPDPPPRWR